MVADFHSVPMTLPNDPIVNLDVFGRRLRAARIMAGYDRVTDLLPDVEQQTGLRISERTLYSLERGEHMPTLEQYVGLLHVLDPAGSWAFFFPAFDSDIVKRWQRDTETAAEVIRQEYRKRENGNS